MTVRELSLFDFRNVEQAELQPCDGPNIICGDNAQGKTNLLEAIWLFTGGRSFRGARERELIRFGSDTARLELAFHAEGRSQTADLAWGGERKRVRLNEIALRSSTELAGRFQSVVFSPDGLMMIKQGPEGRRRFLDACLGQILPKYGKILDSYERILRQRAHLLRDSRMQPGLNGLLDAWDKHLVEYGGYLLQMRTRYTQRLEEYAREIYQGISGGRESFSMCYQSAICGEGVPPMEREAWSALLQGALEQNRGEDIRAGVTGVGPHRDDLDIEISGRSARSFASQGQQRSAVLALKLAECELLSRLAGEYPVVLLDDVMSELDESRRNYLLNHLTGRQVFITCCDPSALAGLVQGSVFTVSAGRVERIRAG